MKNVKITFTNEEHEALIKSLGRHITKRGEIITLESFLKEVFIKGVKCLNEHKSS